jgi:RNA polymerase sigma-70 factor, ECF subfamily
VVVASLACRLEPWDPPCWPGTPACRPLASSPVAEEELVERLRAGDEDAFTAVVRAHHASLCRLARTFVGSGAVAEEVVQDTWLAVVRGLHGFEGRSSLRTWLFHILVNRARTTATREHRGDSSLDPDAERFDGTGVWSSPPVPWSEQVEDRVVAAQAAGLARDLLETLPDAQRRVVLLRDVEGLSAAEVVDLLGVSDGNQRVLLHRGRARLRAGLEAELGRP